MMTPTPPTQPAVRFGEAYRVISRNENVNDISFLTTALADIFEQQGIEAMEVFPGGNLIVKEENINGTPGRAAYLLTGNEREEYIKTVDGRLEHIDNTAKSDLQASLKAIPLMAKLLAWKLSGQLDRQQEKEGQAIERLYTTNPIDIEAEQTDIPLENGRKGVKLSYAPAQWTDELTRVLKTP